MCLFSTNLGCGVHNPDFVRNIGSSIMKTEYISKIIINDLNERDFNNSHGITEDNIDRFLVEPRAIELVDVTGQLNRYWLVFDEIPGDPKNGYYIVYSEDEDLFGLATKSAMLSKEVGLLVGLYGSFVDVLDNM